MIYTLLEQLSKESSRNAKIGILEGVKGTDAEELLKKVVDLAYSPFHVYNVKKFTMPSSFSGSKSLEDAFPLLDELQNRVYGNKEAQAVITSTLSDLSENDAIVFSRILGKDLRCGCDVKTFLKVWPDVTYYHPYMRCSSFTAKNLSKIKFPCFSEVKMDGMYVDIIVTPEKVEYRSREGLFYDKFSSYREIALSAIALEIGSFVLSGEALVTDENGGYLSRKEGNGYLNSDSVDPERIQFVIWDFNWLDEFYSHQGRVTRASRLQSVESIARCVEDSFIKVVEHRICHNVDEIIEHFKDCVAFGEEGTVVKNFDGLWADGTSPDQVKIKIVAEGEVRITGVNEGLGALVGKAGSLSYVSSCGEVVGTIAGISLADREAYFIDPSLVVGKVATVKYNDVVFSQTNKCHSLYLPRIQEIRADKTECDDLQRLKEQLSASHDALKYIK